MYIVIFETILSSNKYKSTEKNIRENNVIDSKNNFSHQRRVLANANK